MRCWDWISVLLRGVRVGGGLEVWFVEEEYERVLRRDMSGRGFWDSCLLRECVSSKSTPSFDSTRAWVTSFDSTRAWVSERGLDTSDSMKGGFGERFCRKTLNCERRHMRAY